MMSVRCTLAVLALLATSTHAVAQQSAAYSVPRTAHGHPDPGFRRSRHKDPDDSMGFDKRIKPEYSREKLIEILKKYHRLNNYQSFSGREFRKALRQ